MSYYRLIPEHLHPQIKKMYVDGNSAQEIVDQLRLETTPRSVQRLIQKMGVSRTVGDAFRNAVNKKRVRFAKKDPAFKIRRSRLKPGLRYEILQRDNFKCKLCGTDATQSPLEIDHIDQDPTNNKPENLRTLCYECNMGRKSVNRTSYSNNNIIK